MIVLVLGGARSGKSAVAEDLAADLAAGGPVTVLATAVVTDDDMAARVEAHRERRPAAWTTVETGPELAGLLHAVEGTVLVDSLGTWLTQLPDMAADVARVCSALVNRRGSSVVVSEEVGLGVHPSSEAGRQFRDALGSLNQAVAGVANQVLLVVAGRAMRLERPGRIVSEVRPA